MVEIPCILCRPILNSLEWEIHSKIRFSECKLVLPGIFPALLNDKSNFTGSVPLIQTCHISLTQSVKLSNFNLTAPHSVGRSVLFSHFMSGHTQKHDSME